MVSTVIDLKMTSYGRRYFEGRVNLTAYVLRIIFRTADARHAIEIRLDGRC